MANRKKNDKSSTALAAGTQSKSAGIRQAIKDMPAASNTEIASLLTERGEKTSAQEVAQQRSKLKKLSQNSIPLTVDDIKTLKNLINERGGLKKVTALLAEIDSLSEATGGEDKLRRGLQELEALAAIPTVP